MDLGVSFGAQNTHGYGSGSPTSVLVLSLKIQEKITMLSQIQAQDG